jgi:tape measure domain-containing protein
MAIGKLLLKLGIDTTNLDKELGKVEKSMTKFGNTMKNVGSNLTQSLTLPIIGLGGASLKAFADMERLELGLTAIMGTSAAAKTELDKLRKTAENPGLALPQVVQASSTLQAVGLNADQARETIVQFGNATARAGKGAVVFDELIFAFTKINSTGSITQEVLNQLTERLPELSGVLQETFGATTAEGINATGISAENFSKKTVEALANLGRAQGGLGNSFDNLKDNVAASLAELGKTINESLKLEEVIIKVSEKVQMLVDKFKALTPQQQENIVKFGLIIAAIGPVILIVGQLAASISSIISLTRILIATFTVLSGGTYLVVAAIGALIAYYATTDEGQKSLSKTGALLSESFDRIKKAFSKTLELLGKLQPLFDLLLLVFGKIAVFTFEVVLSQINAVLTTINFLYDGVIKVLEGLKLIDKQKVEPKVKMGFGGGSAGRPSGAGASWGDDVKDTVIKESPEVAALNAKIKALESQLKTSSKTTNVKNAELDKNLFKFDQFKTLTEITKAKEELDRAVLTELGPKIQEQLGFTNKGLDATSRGMKQAAIDVAVFGLAMKTNAPAFAEPFTAAEEAAAKLQDKIIDLSSDLKTLIEGVIVDVSVALGTQLGNALSGAKFQISALLVPIADAIVSFGKMAIQAGVTALAIKAALKLGNPLLAIASGIALVAIGTAIKNGIGAPKLAEGGLAYGPTLATVGDNRGARVDPEVIAPLSKLKSMMGDMGIGGSLETRISGNDLIILLNRSQKGLNRVQ